jgi:NAD-dependent SIR2 family protein deacetylase
MYSPHNWREAAKIADEADVVLCLGTSMKVMYTIYTFNKAILFF